MPNLMDNKYVWDGRYDWSTEGEEWSASWGGSDMQFFGSLLPRIRRYVPTGTILEIAPGYGRWTQYLLGFSNKFYGVDLSKECISHCNQKFANLDIVFYVNDGVSLDVIPDGSIDFVFSFDSLVHADQNVIGGYLGQLKNKLSPNGVGFIHHSNFRSFQDVKNVHWRDPSVNYQVVYNLANHAGLTVVSQELINWGSNYLIDCFSTFTQPGSIYEQDYKLFENPNFMKEAELLRQLSVTYRR